MENFVRKEEKISELLSNVSPIMTVNAGQTYHSLEAWDYINVIQQKENCHGMNKWVTTNMYKISHFIRDGKENLTLWWWEM